jgi:hypothetical protein
MRRRRKGGSEKAAVPIPPFVFPLLLAVLFLVGALFSALRFANSGASPSTVASLAINVVLVVVFGWMAWTLAQTVPVLP